MAAWAEKHRISPWRGSFADFIEQILPGRATLLTRSAHQYLWDMMRWNGQTDDAGHFRCRLFDDELFGIDEEIDRVAAYFKAAAAGSEVGRRMLLLLGPPSGGKSTMVILLKRGLEEYSHCSEGALYGIAGCPVHESPLHLVPHNMRADFRASYDAELQGELCPHCRARLEEQYAGDFLRMPVERIHLSEAGRCGIGTYAPHDPTTADLADLVGSVDLSKVAQYGDEGDPRAWSGRNRCWPISRAYGAARSPCIRPIAAARPGFCAARPMACPNRPRRRHRRRHPCGTKRRPPGVSGRISGVGVWPRARVLGTSVPVWHENG